MQITERWPHGQRFFLVIVFGHSTEHKVRLNRQLILKHTNNIFTAKQKGNHVFNSRAR